MNILNNISILMFKFHFDVIAINALTDWIILNKIKIMNDYL